MTSKFGSIILVVAILFFLLTTVSAGVRPERFAEQLGLKTVNAGGTNEIYAQYAGFFLAAAILCLIALLGQIPRAAAYIMLIAIFGGLLAGRAFSLMANGGITGFTPTIVSLYAIDAIGLLVAATAYAFDRA
jgi:carbon starvation protein CstA